jgi:hypothetical protein
VEVVFLDSNGGGHSRQQCGWGVTFQYFSVSNRTVIKAGAGFGSSVFAAFVRHLFFLPFSARKNASFCKLHRDNNSKT